MEYLLKHEKPIESKNKALRIYNKVLISKFIKNSFFLEL